MKKTILKFGSALLVACALMMTSCGGDGGGSTNEPDPEPEPTTTTDPDPTEDHTTDPTTGGGTSSDAEIYLEGFVEFRYLETMAGLTIKFDDITETAVTDADGYFELLLDATTTAAYDLDETDEMCATVWLGNTELDFSPTENDECDIPFSDGDLNYYFNTLRLNHFAYANFIGDVTDVDGNSIEGALVDFDHSFGQVLTDANGDFSITVGAADLLTFNIDADVANRSVCIDDVSHATLDLDWSGSKCRNGSDGDWDYGTIEITP